MKWKRRIGVALLVAIAVAIACYGGFYAAVSSTQPYYQKALEQDTQVLREQSQKLESRLTALHSDLQQEGKWRTVVSAAELNGWLATKLPELFPELKSDQVRDPRIAITPEAVFLAAKTNLAGVDTVASVEVEPFATEDGDFAIEIRQVSAGMLPVPSGEVVDRVSKLIKSLDLPLRWTKSSGNSVLIVEHRIWESSGSQQRILEAVELADGELFLSGTTVEVPDESPQDDSDTPADDGTATRESLKSALQFYVNRARRSGAQNSLKNLRTALQLQTDAKSDSSETVTE